MPSAFAGAAAQPQDIEWGAADELQHSLRPPDGMMYPGEMKLAGPRTIAVGEQFRCSLRAVPPAVLSTYDGVYRKPDLRPELTVELRDARGKVLATQRPPFSQATLLKGGHPAYYDVVWQALPLAAKGLPPGEYAVVATMMVEGRIPFNRVEKRLRVFSAAEMRQARSQELTPQALAAAAGLAVMGIEGAPSRAPAEAVLLPAGKSLEVALPSQGRVVVYGLFLTPSPEFRATLAGTTRPVPALKDTGYLLRERSLGVGQGGADKLQIEAKSGPLRLAGVRVEPLDPKVSLVPRPGNGGKPLVVNNDGGSEGFWSPSWDPNQLPEMAERYQGTDVSQFEFSTNLGEMANYRSRYVDFYGEGVEKWPTKGYEAQRRHFLTLDQHEPRLFPWLSKRSREIGLVFWGSQRMNADYGGHPEYSELFHSRFQKEYPEMRVLHSPKQTTPSFYLSYAHAAVRERRIGVLRELVEFGCEGVNLDFCRYPTVLGYEAPMPELFRKAHGTDGTDVPFDDPRWVSVRQQVMNGFMRQVRTAMNAEGRKRSQPVRISVRLPATKYETFGFDPQTWVREGLVDALIPAFPGPERWFDVRPWVAMVRGSKVQVWPGTEYYSHETAGAELTDKDVARGLKPGAQFWMKRSDYLRRAAEAYAAGAHGFYMFNAWTKRSAALVRGISDPVFVAHWRRYLDPESLTSEIATDQARQAFRARRQEAAHRRRRLIFNNDGDDAVTIPKSQPATAESLLARRTTALVGSQVDSIFYCSLYGPTSLHRTTVGEVEATNWEDTGWYAKDSPEGKYFAQVRTVIPEMHLQGTDPLQVMVEFSRAHNLEIFCSMRMNDTHDGAHQPDKPYPGFAKFKQEHPGYLVGSSEKRPPHGQWTAYDYGQAAVRDLTFRRLEEVCRNYDVDGIELDFFRHGVLFKSVAWGGKASAEELDMMTDLIRRLHRMTEEEGLKRGKPLLIAVRVPDSVEYCRGIGLDIERWLREGLVDILITTCYFRLNPWEYSVELGHRYGVPVYASLSESRVNEKVDGKDGEFTRHWNPESYRARAMEVWHAGVDGIYMFNFFDPKRTEWKELGDPKTLEGRDKLYFVTNRNGPPETGYVGWLAGGPALQNRTILTPTNSRQISPGAPVVLDLRFGDDLREGATGGKTPMLSLHLRVQGLKEAGEAEVRLNGQRLENGTLIGDRLVYPVAPALVRRGANRVEVASRDGAKQAAPQGAAGLGSEWRFRKDPEDVGVKGEWFRPDVDLKDWSPIKVPDFWDNTIGQYSGYGWYRTKFAMPKERQGERLTLWFGAVDEQAWVYVNGALVGEHTIKSTGKDVGRLWEQPFTIEVAPQHLRYGAGNTLVVRVHNSMAAGGIHQPVDDDMGHAWRLYDMVLALRYEKAPIKTGDNLLRNHGFASGNGLPDQWTASRGAESVKYVKEGGKVGARCIMIEQTAASALVQSNIPVEHGKTYRVSGYLKTEHFSCTRGDLAIVPTDWPVSYGISLHSLKGTSDWQLLDGIVKIDTQSKDGRFSLYFHIMGSKGRIWLDGVKVEEVLE